MNDIPEILGCSIFNFCLPRILETFLRCSSITICLSWTQNEIFARVLVHEIAAATITL